MEQREGRSAIVIGASMAGLAAARVLSDHVATVTILERDSLDEAPGGHRRGVPQARHAHGLLAAGSQRLTAWFPDLAADLLAAGAEEADLGQGLWHQGGAFRVKAPTGIIGLAVSRPCLEHTVRRHLLRRPGITLRPSTPVERLVVEGDRVTGVADADGTRHEADLVVDCTGRNTRLLGQLAEAGFPNPPESAVAIDVAYGSRILRRRPGDIDGRYVVVAGSPRDTPHRIGALLPIEGDRWTLTVGGYHGDAPPTDPDAFLDYVRGLPTPLLAEVLERAETLTPVMTFRTPSNLRRHPERLDRLPAGVLLLGDALCSFNPVYAQGMSSAVCQAEALGLTLGSGHQLGSAAMAADFYRRAAKVIDNPWTIAAGGDFADPRTTGARQPGTGLVNRYLEQVFLACHTSEPITARMTRVQNLLAPPTSLLAPPTVARVLLAARRSPARRG